MAVLPARSRKPKDKAKVEVFEHVVERWIISALRNRQFFSLDEGNTGNGNRSTLVTSKTLMEKWHALVGDQTLGESIRRSATKLTVPETSA